MDVRWPTSADDQWYWKSDTSSDELDGHYFFYALYYDLVASPDEKPQVAAVVARITDHLLSHDYTLVDHSGTATRWAVFGPDALNHDKDWWEERGLNSLSILSYLRVAEHVTGDEKYAEAAQELIRDHGYAANARQPKVHQGPGTGNQSDNEMALMAFYNLLSYEKDPELRSLWAHTFARYFDLMLPERNPFFNYLYLASVDQGGGIGYSDAFEMGPVLRPEVKTVALEEALDSLRRYPARPGRLASRPQLPARRSPDARTALLGRGLVFETARLHPTPAARAADRRAPRRALEPRPLAAHSGRRRSASRRRRRLPARLPSRPLSRLPRMSPTSDSSVRDPDLPELTVGLQLYSVRDAFAARPEETLDLVSEYGYRNVEWFGGLWGRDAQSWRNILDARGLRAVCAHVALEQLTGDESSRLYDDYRELGCQALICPYLDEYQRAEEDCFETVGKALNAAGYRAIAEGFRLGYHNHDFEYRLPDERGQELDGIEQILTWCSSGNVSAELDVFWAAWAGRDPVATMEALACAPGRLTWLHLKDGVLPEDSPKEGDADEEDRAKISYEEVPFRELGAGDMPLDEIVKTADRLGVETIFIEQDFCRDSFLDGDAVAVAGYNLEVLQNLIQS